MNSLELDLHRDDDVKPEKSSRKFIKKICQQQKFKFSMKSQIVDDPEILKHPSLSDGNYILILNYERHSERFLRGIKRCAININLNIDSSLTRKFWWTFSRWIQFWLHTKLHCECQEPRNLLRKSLWWEPSRFNCEFPRRFRTIYLKTQRWKVHWHDLILNSHDTSYWNGTLAWYRQLWGHERESEGLRSKCVWWKISHRQFETILSSLTIFIITWVY